MISRKRPQQLSGHLGTLVNTMPRLRKLNGSLESGKEKEEAKKKKKFNSVYFLSSMILEISQLPLGSILHSQQPGRKMCNLRFSADTNKK